MRECDWIIIPGNHPAIISDEVYEQVQILLDERKRRKTKNPNVSHLSGKVLKCGCCGYALHYSKLCNPSQYCCRHTIPLPDAECHRMKINTSELENTLLTIIRKQAEVVIGSDDLTCFHVPTDETRKMADCENRIKALSEKRQDCYERFLRGEIDRNAFIAMKNEYTEQIGEFNTQTALLRQIGRDKEARSRTAAFVKEVTNETATPKDIINALVEKVLVFPNNHLEIHWKFVDFTKQ